MFARAVFRPCLVCCSLRGVNLILGKWDVEIAGISALRYDVILECN